MAAERQNVSMTSSQEKIILLVPTSYRLKIIEDEYESITPGNSGIIQQRRMTTYRMDAHRTPRRH